jgi:hypothetical protein
MKIGESRVRRFVFLAASCLVLSCLFSNQVFAQAFCAAESSIDAVPFFIGQLYSDILNRAPDRAGQLYHITALEGLNTANCQSANAALSAGSCEWNDNAQRTVYFLTSPESIAKNGTLADNASFVTALYELLLRRAPDQGGLDWYVSLLNSGTRRSAVVFSFLSSTEYRQRFTCTYGAVNPSCNGSESVDPVQSFVSQSYRDILHRAPDGAGLAWWTSYMTTHQLNMCGNTSASDFSVCDRVFEAQTSLYFFQSSEYQQSNPPINENAAFVTALYEHLLQRAPDGPGLQFYTNFLNQTNDRLGVTYGFLTSNEYRKRFTCYAGARDQLNFGINGHPFNGLAYSNSAGVNFATQISLIQNANLKWYRVNVDAPSSGGDYSQMDLLLSMAQSGEVQLLPVLVPAVNLTTDTLAQLYSESYSGAFNMVNRYKAAIHVWELWNEADVYSMLSPAYNGFLITDYDPTRLAKAEAMLHGLADGARAADPGCLRIVNFGWIHTGFLQALENDAIPYDIVGIHWYANVAATNDPQMGDVTCPGQFLPCPVHPVFFNLIERLQSVTNGKPLWVTENDYWPPVSSNSVAMNMAWQENYLPPMLQTYLSSPSVYPYQMVMIYELLDEPYLQGDAFYSQEGLYQDSESNGHITLGAPKPAYQSVQQLLSGR